MLTLTTFVASYEQPRTVVKKMWQLAQGRAPDPPALQGQL